MRVVTEQQRKLGVPDPGGIEVEQFIAPILQKIDARPGSSSREPSPIIAGDDVEEMRAVEGVEKSWAGDYEWDLSTDSWRPSDGSWSPTPFEKLSIDEKFRRVIRALIKIPKWQQAFLGVGRLCLKHTGNHRDCVACQRREQRMWDLLAMAFNEYRTRPVIYG